MSSQLVDHLHPVLDFAHRLRERLDAVAKSPLWSMEPEEQRDALRTLGQAKAQPAALELRLLAEADRSGATTESRVSTAADWVAIETRQVRREARSDLRLAEALDCYDVLAAAMVEGTVNNAQASAIVTALDRLTATGEFAVGGEHPGRPGRGGRLQPRDRRPHLRQRGTADGLGPCRDVPRPPQHEMVRRRQHQRPGRPTALPAPPQAGARPPVRDQSATQRQGQLPQADVGRQDGLGHCLGEPPRSDHYGETSISTLPTAPFSTAACASAASSKE